MKIGFDNEGYIQKQTERILERVNEYGDKLYLELGGKLLDDYHAARVLPGYKPCNKIKVLKSIEDKVEIIIVISSNDILFGKIRGDSGVTYQAEVLRLIDIFRGLNLCIGGVVITQYKSSYPVVKFKKKLEEEGIRVYKHYFIEGYPTNIPLIVSDKGFGKNEYIETSRPVVAVTAPGPGSGKMAVCLSQLYQDAKSGIKSGYSKFETFPVWDLPTNSAINLAYETATADLGDKIVIDSYHLRQYGIVSASYTRDLEAYPVLDAILTEIYDISPFQSPTDMGVNNIADSIIDLEICELAAEREVIRRYYKSLESDIKESYKSEETRRIEFIMKQLSVNQNSLKEAKKAKDKSRREGSKPVVAIMLKNGRIITGKESELLTSLSACILNALKIISNIEDNIHLIQPESIIPIQKLKSLMDIQHGLQLDCRETLIALAASACSDEKANLALQNVSKLRGTTAHSTVILNKVEKELLKELGIHITCEPVYRNPDRLFSREN